MARVSRFGGPQRCVRVERCIARTENGKYLVKVGRRMAGGSVYVRRVLPTLAAARAYLAEIECARAGYLARHDFRRLIPVDTITDIVTTANDYRPWDIEEGASDSDSVTAYLTGRRTR